MSDEKPKGQPVKLTITSCVVGYQGKNARGDDFTIYEIQACREDGEMISDKKLRSFEELPTGELLDLLVSPFKSEKYGLSFTLSRKNKVGAHQRINQLTKEVEALATRLSAVENWLRKQSGATAAEPPSPAPAQAPPPPPPSEREVARQADLDARFGAEPPY